MVSIGPDFSVTRPTLVLRQSRDSAANRQLYKIYWQFFRGFLRSQPELASVFFERFDILPFCLLLERQDNGHAR